MQTYPNQKIIHINKKEYKDNFLQIGIDEWQHAAKVLSPVAFKLYLYLAGNKNNFNLALSQKAVENALNIKKTAYHDAVKELTFMGYLDNKQGNIQVFTTTPKFDNADMKFRKSKHKTPQNQTKNSENAEFQVRTCGREIDNINKINNTNNNIYVDNNDCSDWLLGDLTQIFSNTKSTVVEIPDSYNPDDFPSCDEDYKIDEEVLQATESLRIIQQQKEMNSMDW